MVFKRGLWMVFALIVVDLLAGCYVPEEEEVTSLTVGVILFDDAAAHGWGPAITAEYDYREIDVQGHRVVLFGQLGAAPDTTLMMVVTAMVERGVDYVFLPAAQLNTSDLLVVYETYPDLPVIANIIARSEVEAMLDTLPTRALGQTSGEDAASGTASSGNETTARTSRDSSSLAGLFFIIVLIAVVIMIAWYRQTDLFAPQGARDSSKIRSKKGKTKRRRAPGVHGRALALEAAARPQMTDFAARGEAVPVIHKLSTYVQGDSHFDESFPIELPSNEFLGECGFSISAPPNVYARDKVAAFEVWLFDHVVSSTQTAVLASEYSVADTAQRTVFAAKGAVSKVGPGTTLVLDLRRLRLQARVMDFQYGYDDDLPARSFFDYVVLEIAVWQK